jgi:hypothetical protein
VAQSRVDVLVKLFRESQEKLKQIVLHPPGKTAKAQAFNQARAAGQLQQIEQILGGLKRDAASWIGEILPIALTDGVRRANLQAEEVGVRPKESPLQGDFGLVDPRTVNVFAKDIYADLSKAADSMGDRASKVLRQTRQLGLDEKQIDQVLAKGVIEGHPRETIKNLRKELEAVHGDTVQVIDKNGSPINFEVGYYAEMVARTKTRQATVVARHERLASLGLDLVAITGRVSKNFCTAYLGQVFSISGKSDKYPSLSSLPGGVPFHPLCTKSTRPFVEELAEPDQLDQAAGDEDQAAMLNVDSSTAQRRFKDLQLHAAVKGRYATTEGKLYSRAS